MLIMHKADFAAAKSALLFSGVIPAASCYGIFTGRRLNAVPGSVTHRIAEAERDTAVAGQWRLTGKGFNFFAAWGG
jgi:hypothetical protein